MTDRAAPLVSMPCSGQNYKHPPMPVANCTIPQKDGTSVLAKCYNADAAPLCDRNGDVKLPFGSAPYVGMGFMVSL